LQEEGQRAVKNLCCVLRSTGVRQVLNSESDLQGHPRALAMAPFDKPCTIFY